MYSGGGYGQKIGDLVNFPLEGLDITSMVIGHKNPDERLIYDCYAVSNHFGNMGFGHYTAFAKSLDNEWYEFDDSRCTQLRGKIEDKVVCEAAYNFFFRRRDWHEKNRMDGVKFDQLAVKPDMSFLQSTNK